MSQTLAKQIYFHVGLSKTASTYLQERVFPLFENVEYIHRMYRYNKVFDILTGTDKEKVLISREFDQQFESELKRFAPKYPDIQIFIVFRRQDSWIASQYRRFFKNGHTIPFTEFFDLKNDKGIFTKKDLDFSAYIKTVEKLFNKKPVVLFYDDLRKDPMAFFDYIAGIMGVKYDKTKVNLKSKHKSYSEKQLKALKAVSKIISVRKDNIKSPFLYQLKRFYTNMIRYSTLYAAKIIPESWFGSEPLIDPKDLEAVKDYYAEDWKYVLEYARENNP
ncbi:MAG: hypothetical protein L3J74_02190 [Bacteroidales bacterium]|nr:hypothetical protein [Bacteroidales bacterium]